jgi:iron complex outermembrane receptor protein
MSNRAIRNLLFGSSLAVIGSVTPAQAQDTSADIVVTARRIEERLQDVPISITVLNQDQLANANVVNAQDLATVTPSLSTNNQFGSENSSFAIRGFVQDIGTQQSVGTYFNDVVAPRGFSNGLVAGDGAGPGSFFDLQNVQVLKGPQGTLFGRNTTGGAVLLVPQRPTDDFEGYVQGGVGNYDMRRVQAVVNLPLGDQAALRLGVDHQQRDGYLENTSGIGPRDFNDVNYIAYRAGLRVDLTPNLENYTLFSMSDSDTNGSSQKIIRAADQAGQFPGFGSLFAPAQDQIAAQGDGFYDFQQDIPNPESVLRTWQLINTTTWDVSDNLTFRNIVSYGELTNDLTTPIFGGNLQWDDPGTPAVEHDPISFSITSPVEHTANQRTFTEEARLEGSNLDNRLVWQGGVYFERSEPMGPVGSFSPVLAHCSDLGSISAYDVLATQGDTDFTQPFSARFQHAVDSCSAPMGDGAGALNITIGETTAQTTGAYLQGTYSLNDMLALTVGYRYTWDRISNTANQLTILLAEDGGVAPGGLSCSNPQRSLATGCESVTQVRTEAPTWLIGLDFTPVEDLLLYAKYARGYRSGTVSPNVVDPVDQPGFLTTADAEQVDTFEVGTKYAWEAGGMRGILNGSLFFNDFQNQQLQYGFVRIDQPAAPTAAPLNVGTSEIYGAEVQASIQPVRGLTFAFDYAYLHTEVTELGELGLEPVFDLNGDGIPDAPFVEPYIVSQAVAVGDVLALTPENKYTLSAQYELPLDQNIGIVTLGAQLVHTDEMVTASSNATTVGFEDLTGSDATDIVNVNVSWESVMGSSVDLNLFGTNVTEEEYYGFIPGIPAVTGYATAVVGQPAMYGITATYRFGG